MATNVDWTSLASLKTTAKAGGGSLFLKLESGKEYKVRPVGEAVQFYKIFINGINRSVNIDVNPPSLVNDIAALLSEHFGQEIKPQMRYAIKVLDRDDNNRVKILESSATIFKMMATWSKGSDMKVGSSKAGDWIITAEGVKPQIKYNASFLKNTPITEAEVKMISELKGKPEYDLSKVYDSVTLENVLEKLNQTSKKGSNSNSNAVSSDSVDF